MPTEDKTDVPGPCFGQWRHRRWENPQTRRYYEAWVLKNLFGDWEVFCVWGGIGSRRGGYRAIPAASNQDALEKMITIDTRRRHRRYFPAQP
jgi:hypothetical protein